MSDAPIDRRYWDMILVARQMAEHKRIGNQANYEGMLFRFAIMYADVFTESLEMNEERLQLLEILCDLLPEYFANSFNKYGRFTS